MRLMSAAPTTSLDAPSGTELGALRTVISAVVAAVLALHREHPDVEDCTHEALRRAIEGRERLRPGEPLQPWVLGIARHVALDYRRTRGRASRRAADGEALEVVADARPSPAERVETNERMARLRRAMDGLAEGPKSALLLLHGEGLGYQAIAERMGVPLGTVATWIARGRKVLAEELSEERERIV
jgi:RNA polymerase sigma factor (sigma-70 family)